MEERNNLALQVELRQMRQVLESSGTDGQTQNAMLRNLVILLEQLQTTVTSTELKLRDSQRIERQLQAAHGDLTSQLLTEQRKAATLEKTIIKNDETARTKLGGEQSRRKTIEAKLEDRIKRLTAERDAAVASTKQSEANLKDQAALEAQVSTLTKERDAAVASTKQSEADLKDKAALKAQVSTLTKERGAASKKIVSLEGKISTLTKERGAAVSAHKSIEKKAKALTRARDHANEANKAANARLAELEAQLDNHEIDIAILGEEIGRLKAEIKTHIDAKTALESDIVHLNQTRQQEAAALGNLLQEKTQITSTIEAREARQAVLEILRKPHEQLKQMLQNRMSVRAYKKARDQIAHEVALITASDLFDAQWYTNTYPDIGTQDPAQHFVQNGLYELRNPSAAFDSLKYHLANPDVTESKIPALLHYLQHGEADGRPIHPAD